MEASDCPPNLHLMVNMFIPKMETPRAASAKEQVIESWRGKLKRELELS